MERYLDYEVIHDMIRRAKIARDAEVGNRIGEVIADAWLAVMHVVSRLQSLVTRREIA